VEVPLTAECKKILNLAGETAERFGHRWVETEHLLIGILRVESSMAAQILVAQGVKLQTTQAFVELAKPVISDYPKMATMGAAEKLDSSLISDYVKRATIGAAEKLEFFLAGLKSMNSGELISFFAENAELIDAFGKRWNREEIYRDFVTLFAPYAKKNASSVVEATLTQTNDVFVATVLWKNALLASMERSWMQRMTVVLVPEAEMSVNIGDLVQKAARVADLIQKAEREHINMRAIDWKILMVQVTAVQLAY
jgi:hypothetical protein